MRLSTRMCSRECYTPMQGNLILGLVVFLTAFLLGVVAGRIDPVPGLSRPDIVPEINEPDREIGQLLKAIEVWNLQKRAQSVARLEEIARESPENREKVVFTLTNEISYACGLGNVMSDVWFEKVGTMSYILADLHSVESLDPLIDCSNHTLPAHGWGINNYATMGAILQFKQDALPALRRELSFPHEDKYLVCAISSMLGSVGGREEERLLKQAYKNEPDEEIQWCFRKSFSYLERVRKEGHR